MARLCEECKEEVESGAALRIHYKEQRELGNKHYHCQPCLRLFHTPEGEESHRHEFHAAAQHLRCPGCDDRFTSVSSLIEHIEKDLCKVIKNHDYVARREHKLAFSRELELRNTVPTEMLASLSLKGINTSNLRLDNKKHYDYTPYLSRVKAVSASNSKNGASVAGGDASVKPVNQTATAWDQKKNLFPDAPAPVRLTEIEDRQRLEDNKPAWSEHDPRNPGWKAEKYFVKCLNKYKCPHDRCPKSFKNAAGFRTHLSSAVHTGLIRVQCPRCCRWFDTMTALTAHVESQGIRCDIHKTKGYAEFLDQATAGIVDLAGVHADGTNKYAVTESSRKFFGSEKGSQNSGDNWDNWEEEVWDNEWR
ncbi:uncharacterized protein C8A04DRAFT_9216 [Dichotomopilus funicola]|uniref:C2H2-type domain-containing protein n=1 Tax=Dichotomopilus funicola TaxID=1934379 RepID=A0AAN6ZRA8_9PEZI|nr:hypothetical protein C8A04DRAFT_9216 [Dichotomopilus funicola]